MCIVPNNMLNHSDFFSNIILPPPTPGLFFIRSSPDTFTVLPPTKQLNANGLIVMIVILAVLLVANCIVLFCLCKWCKKQHQDESKIKEDEHVKKNNKPRKVMTTKNVKKSNVSEIYIPVYGYDKRLETSNERLIEARYDKEPTINYDYEGDVEYETDEMYISSGSESKFYEKSNMSVISPKYDTKSITYQEGEDTSSEGETSHNRQFKEVKLVNDATAVDYAKDDRKSNACEGEGDTCSESEITLDEQSTVMGLAIDVRKSNVSERDLESALIETGPLKSKDVMIRS